MVDLPVHDADSTAAATAVQLAQLAGASEVIAIVSGIPEAEENNVYGPYRLLINGTTEVADGAGVANPW